MAESRPVLLTGASGALGRVLAQTLTRAGGTVRMTDIAPFADPLPDNATFTRADLEDGVAILRLAEGCGAIVHLGGTSTDQPFEDVIGPNIRGLYHIYEAARRENARVVFASSNHAIGFHERTTPLDADCSLRPDTYYGLSKAYGELMGGLYFDKHGGRKRLGPDRIVLPGATRRPHARELAVARRLWPARRGLPRCRQSRPNRDLGRVEEQPHDLVAARRPGRDRLSPQDSADPWTDKLQDRTSGDPVNERYQGGAYCAGRLLPGLTGARAATLHDIDRPLLKALPRALRERRPPLGRAWLGVSRPCWRAGPGGGGVSWAARAKAGNRREIAPS
jgi:uronate dehydrogenase